MPFKKIKEDILSIGEMSHISRNFFETMRGLANEFTNSRHIPGSYESFSAIRERVSEVFGEDLSDEEVVESFASFATNNFSLFHGIFISGIFIFLRDQFFTQDFSSLISYKEKINSLALERGSQDVAIIFSGNESMASDALRSIYPSWIPVPIQILRGATLETVLTDAPSLYISEFSYKEIISLSSL